MPDDATIERCPFVTRINPEPENDKPELMRAFDEIVTGPVDSVHIERMSDDCYWMCIYKDGVGQRIIIAANNSRAKIVARTEMD
jgi:hypothetical protein